MLLKNSGRRWLPNPGLWKKKVLTRELCIAKFCCPIIARPPKKAQITLLQLHTPITTTYASAVMGEVLQSSSLPNQTKKGNLTLRMGRHDARLISVIKKFL